MPGKNILAVDASSGVLSVAIKSKSGKIFEKNLEGTPRHSEELFGLIETGLKRLRLKKNDLDCFLWGLGPGSFTGLRIGLSILKGFHLGFKKPAFGTSSLDLIALGAKRKEGKLAVCLDARRERIYTALYEYQKGVLEKTFNDCPISFDEFIKRVDSTFVFVGDALAVYGEKLRKKLGKKALFLDPSFWYPQALFLIRLFELNSKWLRPLTLQTMRPQYLRASEAEESLPR